MKITRKGKFIYIEDYTPELERYLTEILTVETGYKQNSYSIKLLWKVRKKNILYTYFGYAPYIQQKLKKRFGLIVEIDDKEELNKVNIQDVKEKVGNLNGYILRDYQLFAVVKALAYKYGAIQVATGGGKSLIIGALIKYIDKPSLIITPTVQLAEQMYKNLINYGFDKEEVQILKSTTKQKKKYNIAVINTVYSLTKLKSPILEDIKVICYDEAHRKQSPMYRQVDKYFDNKVEYNLGFTGSLFRTKEIFSKKSVEDFISIGLLGEPIVNIDIHFLIEKGFVAQPEIFIETIPYDVKKVPATSYWNTVLKEGIVENHYRNERISEWISYFESKGLTSLIILDRISHAKEVFFQLPEHIKENTIIILGSRKAMIYQYRNLREIKVDYNEVISEIEEGKYKCIIGTTVLKEGTDIPAVDTLILGYAGKSIVAIVQKLGRALRIRENKTKTFIIDFYDSTHHILRGHSFERISFYREQKFPIYTNKKQFKQSLEQYLTNIAKKSKI